MNAYAEAKTEVITAIKGRAQNRGGGGSSLEERFHCDTYISPARPRRALSYSNRVAKGPAIAHPIWSNRGLTCTCGRARNCARCYSAPRPAWHLKVCPVRVAVLLAATSVGMLFL